jgi:type II secretory ATPase GspE/PulE/Tfp pilus assembly ATPase PilB-like protein
MEMCTASKTAREYFRKLTSLEHGLIISCGPTGSGKTTTIHALLSMIVQNGKRKIVSLEDPVEIHSPHFLQIPVTAALSYEAGIEQLMRHDPDVIFIGECRSSYTARMAVRAALTGCLVFTTLHAGSGKECLHRLVELGAARDDLACVLKGVFSQRLIVSQSETGKECIYELWDENTLENLFENESGANPLCTMEQCKADAGK